MMRIKLFLSLFFIIFLASCGSHDTSTPETALLGHWLEEGGKTEYYFDEGKMIMVDKGRRMDMECIILQSHDSENWIKIKLTTGYEGGHHRHLVFDSDRESLTDYLTVIGVTVNGGRWNYIDNKRSP